jgi:hypothetical protein
MTESKQELPLDVEFAASFLDGIMESESAEIQRNWKSVRRFLDGRIHLNPDLVSTDRWGYEYVRPAPAADPIADWTRTAFEREGVVFHPATEDEAYLELQAAAASHPAGTRLRLVRTTVVVDQYVARAEGPGASEQASEPGSDASFQAFVASRRELDDVSKAGRYGEVDDDGSVKDAGYEYATGLFISKVGDHWPAQAKSQGSYHLLIANEEWIDDDLGVLERTLFDSYRTEIEEEAAA